MYTVREIFYTLQGEGARTGRPAVFCRFSGCNLWTGREDDRADAVCRFCDTEFVGVGPDGGKFATAADLAAAVSAAWPSQGVRPSSAAPYVVCTGGEPLLQLDRAAIDAFHDAGFEVAVETNGTCLPPDGIDWITVSPKAHAETVLRHGDELKLVFPQEGAPPERYADWDFRFFYLQPMDGADLEANTRAALEYCLRHPQWRLSLQTHKLLGIR
jgi:7-carboxy-7-deazaguanine synthase (Cx14CxxC type)